MYRLKISLEVYEKLKMCLGEIRPGFNVILTFCDYALSDLGFVSSPPCIVDVLIDTKEMNTLLDELMEYETDSVDMPESSLQYKRYERYGWMYDLLLCAEDTYI